MADRKSGRTVKAVEEILSNDKILSNTAAMLEKALPALRTRSRLRNTGGVIGATTHVRKAGRLLVVHFDCNLLRLTRTAGVVSNST